MTSTPIADMTTDAVVDTVPYENAEPWNVEPAVGDVWRTKMSRQFNNRYKSLRHWHELPLGTQLQAPTWARNHVASTSLRTGSPLPASYVLACRTPWGTHVQRIEPAAHDRFCMTAQQLGFAKKETRRQWVALAKICAVAGVTPTTLTLQTFTHARQELLTTAAEQHDGMTPRSLSTPLYGLEGTLTSFVGIVTTPRPRQRSQARDLGWRDIENVAPELATTLRAYLTQIALSLRPGTIKLNDTSLRTFARFLTTHHPAVKCLRDVKRLHIETYKSWLPTNPGYRGAPSLSFSIITNRLGNLKTCFDRIIEWDWRDAPDRTPVYAGDLPILDQPLPRFLDDAAASKLLAAAKQNPDPFARLAVILLARTGMRRGELLELETDAITLIGEHHWLRIPIGKLHNDRYIPLDPTLKNEIDEWLAKRPEQSAKLMFTERGRPIPPKRLDKAVHDAATRAGIGHVTPHKLRHTLATQAINRGMSLEAIAALLGHRDLKMTMNYARIADRTVANEYFNVTSQIEALYEHPAKIPADLEGAQMRKLRIELTHRLLGNGYCTRPPKLDCHYESLCERCTFYQTDNDFRPILTKQHDDAASKGQHDRRDLFKSILQNLHEPAP